MNERPETGRATLVFGDCSVITNRAEKRRSLHQRGKTHLQCLLWRNSTSSVLDFNSEDASNTTDTTPIRFLIAQHQTGHSTGSPARLECGFRPGVAAHLSQTSPTLIARRLWKSCITRVLTEATRRLR